MVNLCISFQNIHLLCAFFALLIKSFLETVFNYYIALLHFTNIFFKLFVDLLWFNLNPHHNDLCILHLIHEHSFFNSEQWTSVLAFASQSCQISITVLIRSLNQPDVIARAQNAKHMRFMTYSRLFRGNCSAMFGYLAWLRLLPA